MFQKIKNWLYKKFKINKNFSIEEVKNQLLKIENTSIVALYSYPKYGKEILVLVIDDNTIFDILQKPAIKEVLKNISFVCLSVKEIRESTDVFSLQFFDIKTTATYLYGKDIFENIIISKADLRRKMEFDIRNKSIYLRQEAVKIPARILIHNIVAELKPVMRAAEYLKISLPFDVIKNVEEKVHDLENGKNISEKELINTLSEVSTLLEKWADEVEKYENTL